jgi:succinylglutamate desuccinylase
MARGDFSALAGAFRSAGFQAQLPAPAVLALTRPGRATRPSVVLSVCVHGDETGPLELLAQRMQALAAEPQALAVDLMLCVGNVDAIAAGNRYIDADLNRMFRPVRGELASAREAARADQIIAATASFFAGAGPRRWHLDLHTAIRASHYPAFAIVPELIEEVAREALIDWLGQAGIGAVILNPHTAGTYSYYSAEHHGAAASTVELGRIGKLGENNLGQFTAAADALERLLRGLPPGPPRALPRRFGYAQEIIKHSPDFRMFIPRSTPNFTAFRQGELLAIDGSTSYVVQHPQEWVVFPNPDVRVGLRAGIMVVPY